MLMTLYKLERTGEIRSRYSFRASFDILAQVNELSSIVSGSFSTSGQIIIYRTNVPFRDRCNKDIIYHNCLAKIVFHIHYELIETGDS